MLVVLTIFWSIQFQGDFGLVLLDFYMTLLTGIGTTYVICALSPTADLANALVPMYGYTLVSDRMHPPPPPPPI